jgi:hypothetical protein
MAFPMSWCGTRGEGPGAGVVFADTDTKHVQAILTGNALWVTVPMLYFTDVVYCTGALNPGQDTSTSSVDYQQMVSIRPLHPCQWNRNSAPCPVVRSSLVACPYFW